MDTDMKDLLKEAEEINKKIKEKKDEVHTFIIQKEYIEKEIISLQNDLEEKGITVNKETIDDVLNTYCKQLRTQVELGRRILEQTKQTNGVGADEIVKNIGFDLPIDTQVSATFGTVK